MSPDNLRPVRQANRGRKGKLKWIIISEIPGPFTNKCSGIPHPQEPPRVWLRGGGGGSCQVLRPAKTTATALKRRVVLRTRFDDRGPGGYAGRARPRAVGPPGSHVRASPPARQVRYLRERCQVLSATSNALERATNPRSGLRGGGGRGGGGGVGGAPAHTPAGQQLGY